MQRYFIEVAYKGTAYAGFQIQENANTIQAEIEKALQVFYKQKVDLTGSSRTDAGVHAKQNFFHFDIDIFLSAIPKALYHLNAILPRDILVKNIFPVKEDAHCRFDALSRSYEYAITNVKNPFVLESAYYYPYTLDIKVLNDCAAMLLEYTNFESFAKKNTQVYTHECSITKSEWSMQNDLLLYNVTGNRFLRGMVRGLVGTMLLVGREKYSVDEFRKIIESNSSKKTDFSAPAHGLILKEVHFSDI
jgi:tRNA pseudouridine38-40 synthase